MYVPIKEKIYEIIDDMHWRLEQSELELRKKIKELEEINFNNNKFSVDNRKIWFRTIVNYMTNGLTYTQAVQLLCQENDFDVNRIEKVLSAFNYQRKATELYAKIYAIKKLKKAKFTNKKIAEILEISASQVVKLSKCNIILNDK